jgi:hemerythrin
MKKEFTELVTWSDRFSCGIKLIDDQHRGLVALVNDMFNHVAGNEIQESEYMNNIIRRAVKYVKIHFAAEEKIMLAAKVPDYSRHKKAHSRFIITLVDYIYKYKTGKRINLFAFTKFLKEWILSHIALMDKQCFSQIKIIPSEKQRRLAIQKQL